MTTTGNRLWRHPDFLKLWVGQTLSRLGSEVTWLALPSAAILLLHAGPAQVGLLNTVQFLAFPLLGLFAGVWVDRLPHRQVLIGCDLARLVTLGSIPAVWLLGRLGIGQLLVVAALTGVATVFFDVAYQAYLPGLIDREDLVEGNSRLQASQSAAGVGGPALAGFLLQAVGSALAVLTDTVSYLASVLMLWWIRRPEQRDNTQPAGGLTREIWEGIRLVAGHDRIRWISLSTATANLGSSTAMSVYLLFAYRYLHLTPATIGVISAIGSLAAVVGAMAAPRLTRWAGLGPVLALSLGGAGMAAFLIPLASLGTPVALLSVASLGQGLSTVYNVSQVSYRQTVVAVGLQGRLNATVRTFVWGTIPLGSALGGLCGSDVGLLPTLCLGAGIQTLGAVWLLLGPVQLGEMPTPADGTREA